MSNPLPQKVAYLLSPQAIRDRAWSIYELALSGETPFMVKPENLDAVADYVIGVMNDNYPDGQVPFHSRWTHFQAGGVDRLSEFKRQLAGLDRDEQTRARLDLAMVSVLLDAGAGPQWSYQEPNNDQTYNRSEGLALAGLHMFLNGDFSADKRRPYRVDAEVLAAFPRTKLQAGFQVTDANPLVGLEGRLALLHQLGNALKSAQFPGHRPAGLLDALRAEGGNQISAPDLLLRVLLGLGAIWPGRITLHDVNLGDVWRFPLLAGENDADLVPFHKLSQWLTYSLMEPIMDAGVAVTEINALTGLAEYRNGGLMLDKDLIALRDETLLDQAHKPGSALIVAWRALTIVLLDQLAERIRRKLNVSAEAMPLVRILEGGAWWAGRRAAKEKRPDGTPPLRLESDGTVF